MRRLVVLLLVVVAACGGGDDDDVVATTSTAAQPVVVTAMVDWSARTIAMDGDTPFDVNFCDGDAPLLCIVDDGTLLGSIELATFPEAVPDFDAWAASFYAGMQDDRIAGCDPDYVLDGDDPVPAGFAGATGVRYGFTGTVDGEVVERVLGYAMNDGAELRLLVANALSDDGCLAREGELPVDVIDELEPVMAAIAAGSTF